MILPSITELLLVGVYERGIPNKERIVFRAASAVEMGRFGIFLGVKTAPGQALPIRDNFFWFGNGFVNMGDWVFVYTGPGTPRVAQLPNANEKLYTVFWGRNQVILHEPNVVPILVRMDAVTVDNPQALMPAGTS